MTYLTLIRRFWPYITIGGVILAVLLLAFCADRSQERAVDQARDAGASEERAESLNQTIQRTERANNAAEAIKRDPVARNAECLRHARNPEDCSGQ